MRPDRVPGPEGVWQPRASEDHPLAPSPSALRATLGEALAAGELEAGDLQAARLVAYQLHARAWPPGRASAGLDPEAATREVDPSSLRRHTGLSAERTERGLRVLERYGFVTRRAGERGRRLALTDALLAPDPVAGRIAWREVLDHMEGETVAQLVFLAFIELLGAPETFRDIPHDRLARNTHLGDRSVTKGVGLLVDRGLIERHERRGTTNRYALPRAIFSGELSTAEPSEGVEVAAADPRTSAPPARESEDAAERSEAASTGRTIRVGGEVWELPKGLARRIRPRRAGGWWLVLGHPDTGLQIPFDADDGEGPGEV